MGYFYPELALLQLFVSFLMDIPGFILPFFNIHENILQDIVLTWFFQFNLYSQHLLSLLLMQLLKRLILTNKYNSLINKDEYSKWTRPLVLCVCVDTWTGIAIQETSAGKVILSFWTLKTLPPTHLTGLDSITCTYALVREGYINTQVYHQRVDNLQTPIVTI